MVSSDLLAEVKNLRSGVLKLHLKHKALAGELQIHRDSDAKNTADLKRLKGTNPFVSPYRITYSGIDCIVHCIMYNICS